MSHSPPKYQGFELSFNRNPSTLMHIDLNSCFATIEQQANPLLRGKPVAVAAYNSPGGCILAASYEAKRLGVQTGLRVKEGKMLCPDLIIKEPDVHKYRNVHLSLKQLLGEYTNDVSPKSIDEFVLNLEGYPAYSRGMEKVAQEIKRRIKQEIGDWLTVSIGMGPNRFLAKTAAGLHKPDGLDEINFRNVGSIYRNLELEDLNGIARQNRLRLHSAGIFTVAQMFAASITKLKAAFRSVLGYYWYVKLKGFEIDDVDFERKSFGNSYALPKPFKTSEELSPLLVKLVEKAAFRMRRGGYMSQGAHLSVVFRDHTYWHKGVKTRQVLFDSRAMYQEIARLHTHCPYHKPVAQLAVSFFNLSPKKDLQLDLFGQTVRQEQLTQALDHVTHRWGKFVITPARMLSAKQAVPDRIAFGGVKELEEYLFNSG